MEPPERAAPKYNLICYIFAVYRRHIELAIAFESGGRRAVKLNIESVIRRKIRVHGVYGINELDFFYLLAHDHAVFYSVRRAGDIFAAEQKLFGFFI